MNAGKWAVDGEDHRPRTVRAALFAFVILPWLGCGLGCKSDVSMRLAPLRSILEGPVRLRMDQTSVGLPLIEARVNRAPPRLFVVDTGTTDLILSRKLIGETQPLALATSCVMETPTGPKNLGPVARVESLQIGSASFHGLNAGVVDLSNLEAGMGCELGGVIGMGVFADCRVTLDYPRSELVLEPLSDAEWSEKSRDAAVVPLRLSNTGVPFIPLRIRGATVWAMLDSGYGSAFWLSRDTVSSLHLEEAPIRLPGYDPTFLGNVSSFAFRVPGSVFLGPYEFVAPIALTNFGSSRTPGIGHDALRHFAVTIDLQKKRVRFARPDATPIGPPPPVRHWGFYFQKEGNFGHITGPIEVANLDRLGLEVDDRVTAVNGVAISQLSGPDLQRLVDAHDMLFLTVIRREREMLVRVPVTILVR